MKIEFVYGPFSANIKKFDFKNLYNNQSGLTGSEFSCIKFAEAMAKKGHEVSLYMPLAEKISNWNNVKLFDLSEFYNARVPPDVFYSWNEPDMLKYTPSSSLRMVNQQLNDFGYCEKDFDNYVDIYTSPSAAHLEYISQFTPKKEKWAVIHNCIDPTMFDLNAKKQEGSVIYASSADRGLHLLLQEWKKIKKEVPNANLSIYYNFDSWFNSLKSVDIYDKNIEIGIREFKNRADYIAYALEELKNFDVVHYKSVSKNDLYKKMSESVLMAYPCSTVRYTEGFSVSLMESCYSMATVASTQDALGDIYKNSGIPMVSTPTTNHIDDFTNNCIKMLKDKVFREETMNKSREFALNYTFEKEALKLETLMLTNLK